MGALGGIFRRRKTAATAAKTPLSALFVSPLAPVVRDASGEVLVWQAGDGSSSAAVTDQFTTNAETYHQRYAASDQFEALFRQALAASGAIVPDRPLILDLGSGSGVNSIAPCARIFPGARMVATDLSADLLAILAKRLRTAGGAEEVICVRMDAMGDQVAPARFDLVTGASILHHLDHPQRGLMAAARALKPGGVALFTEPFSGWALVRLAFERILAEAVLRNAPLEPLVEDALRRLVVDVRERSLLARPAGYAEGMDDKWLFTRGQIERGARAAGFGSVVFVPHNDHASLYRDAAGVHLRLTTGRSDLELPDWALAILDQHDAAMNLQAKRDLMLEGAIVLAKPG